ncbi:SLBB domain-containing protein [Leptothoe sp. LEGE 181152]|nr:SLBB domain-containing protein [Leptothoe sp. LEGE 181152]
MRLLPLLTLSIAPCGVLGWYGTQKLMAEPIKSTEPDAPPIKTADSQTAEPFIEQQPSTDVRPWASINQPKFSSPSKSSLSKNAVVEVPGTTPVTQQTVQGSFSLSIATNPPVPVRIDRNQIRQVVSESTQSALAALSLGPSASPEVAVITPEIAVAPALAEIITAEVTNPVQADEISEETATTANPEVTAQPQTDETSSEVKTAVSEQPFMAVANSEVITQPQLEQPTAQSSDNSSTEQLEIEQSEELYPDLMQSSLDQSVISASETPLLDSTAAEIPDTEIAETEISESLITLPFVDADATLPTLTFGREASHIVAQQTSTPALSPFVNENYILGPGDVISVNVFNVPDYSGQHSIAADGSITLPQLGRVLVHSMTLQQASDEIAARYEFTLESPMISVQVVQQRPVQVAIAGEVIQPGLYTVSPEGTPYPRLFTALQQAGGLTQAADIKQVEVRRRTANGGQTTLRVDLFALLNNGDISQNIFLQDGDTIMIPSATAVDMAALDQLSASNLRNNAGQPIDIAIVGEVNQPGPYRLGVEGGRTTVVQALQQAGGITPSANLRDVQLRRKTRQGDDQFFEVNLWELLQTGDLSQDLVLQQGDTLVVPTAPDTPIAELTAFTASTLSTGTIEVNVLGEVESPGAQQVRANTSLNQAILSAGGLNRRTRGKVTLIRFNPDGTVSQQPIKVDLSQEINEETNPILRPNDVILVGRSARAAFEDTFNDLSGTLNLLLPLLLLGL